MNVDEIRCCMKKMCVDMCFLRTSSCFCPHPFSGWHLHYKPSCINCRAVWPEITHLFVSTQKTLGRCAVFVSIQKTHVNVWVSYSHMIHYQKRLWALENPRLQNLNFQGQRRFRWGCYNLYDTTSRLFLSFHRLNLYISS